MMKQARLTPKWKPKCMAMIGLLGIVLLAGTLLFLSLPGRSLAAAQAAEPPPTDPHQGNPTYREHLAVIAADAELQRTWDVLAEVAGTDGAVNPHAGNQVNAPINTSLLDFKLPGTQPGGLTTALADSTTCTGCHVDHIRDNFNGSMMTNGVRDPLFRAALVIANKDANYGGDLCIRCHSPTAWLNNRSAIAGDPTSTDGRLINAEDLHGITCTVCHRMVPTTPLAGEAAGDAAERAALTGPFLTGSGAYIIDRADVRRGPFNIAAAPHAVAESSFLRSAEMCATCHDIDNPLLTFDASSGEFKLNALNTPASTTDRLFPLDRSYSEWKLSTFGGGGVSGLDYPGLKRSTGTEGGPITVCQDCHMPMVASPIAGGGPTRTVGQHQWVGASAAWQDGITQVWDNVALDTRFDATQTAANKTLSLDLLKRSAQLDVAIVNGQLEVKITNNSGHKLPSGYAEGRRMWLEIYQLRGSTPVFTSGLMSGVIGPLINDPYLKQYEIKLGLSDAHAQNISRPELAGEGFHLMLNNKVFKDNRIPPRGFNNAAFATRDMQPVGVNYADGQYWDTTYYPIHPAADSISVRLMYQTASSEYLDFLASEANFTVSDAVRGDTNWGQIIATLRGQNIGKPVVIAGKNLFIPRQFVAPSGTDTGFCTDAAQPCKTITYALTQAVDKGEIRVAAGIYQEQIQVTKQISLTGGFATTNWITPSWTVNQTILDGQQAYRPLTINADTVRVDGFIVRNGNTTGGDRLGGGLFIGGVNVVDRATLLNLRLENNVASHTDSGDGGGLAVAMGNTFNIPAQLTLSNVTVLSNTASTGHLGSSGGGMSILGVGNSPLNVEMTNVTVQGNTGGNDFSSSGGGMVLSLNGGQATLRQVRILNNRAAQIKTFLGGPSQGGGIFLSGGHLLLENVLLAGNAGERGDALWIEPGNLVSHTVAMNYVTIADNYRLAGDAAAAVRMQGAQVRLVLSNTLISGNPIAFEAQNNAQPPTLAFTSVLIDNNIGTVISGAITTNGTPLRGAAGYVNAAAGDYHLTAASNAVDQGNGLPPLVDLDGAVRPKGLTTDIGAYEYTPGLVSNQTVAFSPLVDKLLTDPAFSINATASSGLAVSFASLTPTICTVNGNTVTLLTTGTCTLQATQAGNASFNPAPAVVQSFTVKSTQKAEQTITFAKPADKKLGDLPFGLSASASSGLPVSFTGNTAGVCTVSAPGGLPTVTLLAVGVCSITATQDGNAAINPASPVTQSFSVTRQGGGGDSYEDDDDCASAHLIASDGSLQDHTFHQPADQDWVRFATTTGVRYRIEVNVPPSSPADVDLELYPACDQLPNAPQNPSFSPNVRLDFTAPQSGDIFLRLTNHDAAVAGNAVAYQLTVRTFEPTAPNRALIIVAGRLKLNDPLQSNIHNITQAVYQTFQSNQYDSDHIQYLATDASLKGNPVAATTSNLKAAITTWAAQRLGDKGVLTLYLVDHGKPGLFFLDEVNGQRITPADLNTWLTELEGKVGDLKINVIIEACESGSFIQGNAATISKPGRLIITSTNADNDAKASKQGAYFSDHFLTGLAQGFNLYTSFFEARRVANQIYVFQEAWVEGDGDGRPNELEDAAVAASRGFNYPGTFDDPWPPHIFSVTPPTVIANFTGEVRADVRDDVKVREVWGVVYPPGYLPPATNQQLQAEVLPTFLFTDLGNNQFAANYPGFTQAGVYRIVVQAEDNDGLKARPVVIEVNVGGLLFLPLIKR